MLHYILQIIFFQLFFLLVYEFFLKKETFFNYNRLYLLVTPILAFLIPWLRLEFLVEAVPENARIIIPKMISSQPDIYRETLPTVIIQGETGMQINWWLIAYLTGVLFSTVLLLLKYRSLTKFSNLKQVLQETNFRIIEIPNSNAAYTFFNTVFLGDRLSHAEKQHILSHELVHVKQKHSLDLVFFEILKIVFWFNPLIYIYQNRIAGLHEYIADNEVVKTTEKKTYYEQLLNTAFSTKNISFINQFFNHSLIKKRIFMLQKNKSSQRSKFKFLLVIPLMLAMLTYVACSDENHTAEITNADVQELSDEQLKDVLREELNLMQEQGAEFMEIANAFMVEKGEHIKSREAYYRFQVYLEMIHRNSIQRAKKNGTYDKSKDIDFTEGLSKTYADYVAYRKTQPEINDENGMPLPPPPPGSARDIYNRQYENSSSVPFAVIEKVPAFPGCEQWEDDVRKNCTTSKITEFVSKNFDTSLGKQLGLNDVTRVIVQFRIDETGNVQDIRSRAAHPELEAEAKRVIASMPQMEPGEQNGQPVSVMYSLPIAFQVN